MKKLLIIVDEQVDFTSGVLGNAECEATVQAAVDIINENAYDEIYLTRDTHQENYLDTQEGRNLPVKHCIENTDGWQIRPEIMEAVQHNYASEKAHIIDKPSFGSLDLANLLRDKYSAQQTEVEITLIGVCTGICVISNSMLVKAALPEAGITIIEKACACVTPESHKTAIEAMKLCQINVI